jgi:hypothetical protein
VYILPFENKKSKELLARRNPRRYFATAATLILRAPSVDSDPAQKATDGQNTGESLWPTITLSTIDDHLRRTQGVENSAQLIK